jgi:hypothetical protein
MQLTGRAPPGCKPGGGVGPAGIMGTGDGEGEAAGDCAAAGDDGAFAGVGEPGVDGHGLVAGLPALLIGEDAPERLRGQ